MGWNTYKQRGGRVFRLMSSLGSLLQIKPVLRIHNGVIEMDKMRTFSKAMQRVVDRVRELGPLEQLYLVHSHAVEKLENLRRPGPIPLPDRNGKSNHGTGRRSNPWPSGYTPGPGRLGWLE